MCSPEAPRVTPATLPRIHSVPSPLPLITRTNNAYASAVWPSRAAGDHPVASMCPPATNSSYAQLPNSLVLRSAANRPNAPQHPAGSVPLSPPGACVRTSPSLTWAAERSRAHASSGGLCVSLATPLPCILFHRRGLSRSHTPPLPRRDWAPPDLWIFIHTGGSVESTPSTTLHTQHPLPNPSHTQHAATTNLQLRSICADRPFFLICNVFLSGKASHRAAAAHNGTTVALPQSTRTSSFLYILVAARIMVCATPRHPVALPSTPCLPAACVPSLGPR